ncbi:MAG: hypothetical protein KC587_12750 [Nitrospira sp.]|nr:hypothetical protein [Nitrospira sp.]MCB9352264.1 hypothetical protein [Lewinellaceae bacterium]
MTKEITPFDAYEIHGCKDYDGFVEQVEDDEAEFWSIYGHISNQGLECIGDFKTRRAAEEVLKRIEGKKQAMKIKATVVIIVEGGIVQNAYCPDPDICLDYMVVDYDCEEGGINGLEELVEALERADAEERKHDFQPSISGTLENKRAVLAKLKQEE